MFKLSRNFNTLENVFQGQATLAIPIFFLWSPSLSHLVQFQSITSPRAPDQFIPVYKVPSYPKSFPSRHERKTNKSNKEVFQTDFSFKQQIGFFLFFTSLPWTPECSWPPILEYEEGLYIFWRAQNWTIISAKTLHVQNLIGVLFYLYCHI